MGIHRAGRAERGSQLWIQHYVNQRPEELNAAIAAAGGPRDTASAAWLSPGADDQFAEYSDREFLDLLDVKLDQRPLEDFWPRGGPHWDALGRTEAGDLLLVEAKSHIPEMFSNPTGAGADSRQRIEEALAEAAEAFRARSGCDWTQTFYQYANRLAHLYLLRDQNELPAWLIFLGFTGDDTIENGVATEAEWRAGAGGRARAGSRQVASPQIRTPRLPASRFPRMTMGLRIVLWNVEWARPRTARGEEMRRQMIAADPDLICITEGFASMLPGDGSLIDSDPDYGYPIKEGRRKVLLWSKKPWRQVDRIGSPDLPGGRYVSGVTDTPTGPLEVFGVCIPWRDAHVRSGRKDRNGWEDHVTYLRGLRQRLSSHSRPHPAVVIGDYNQRVPRHRAPVWVHDELLETFDGEWTICTAGELDGGETFAIDHVAHTDGLACTDVRVLPKVTGEGLRLSDHFGLVVDLS